MPALGVSNGTVWVGAQVCPSPALSFGGSDGRGLSKLDPYFEALR